MGLRLDHVAIAVWDLRPTVRVWAELLGGRYVQGAPDYAGYAFLQLEYDAGSRVELLSPTSDRRGFLARFLEREGEGVHHLTFIAEDLQAECARLRSLGQRVMDEDFSDPHWMEAFISAQLGGRRLLVQLAQSDLDQAGQDRLHSEHSLESLLRTAAELSRER
jgi:methylmalonyl-CoA/ethylmalonyl-CoA epimerase